MKIATSPTREKFPLSYKKILKKTIANSLVILVPIVPIGVIPIIPIAIMFGLSKKGLPPLVFTLIPIIAIILIVLIIVVIVLNYLYQRWYFATYYYDLAPNYVVIRKGPLTPAETTIPYERIQDVYVDQDLLDRILGLYDVHIASAALASGMRAHIDGVEKAGAEGLRESILKTIQEKIGNK